MHDLERLLDARQIRGYARLAIASYLVGFALLLFFSPKLVDFSGKPIGYDFITFWSAGRLTLGGDPAGAFDMGKIHAAQRMAVPASDKLFLWHYPPTFQIVAAALALLPYLLSYAVFVGLSLWAYAATVRHLVGWREPVLLLLAFPGAFLCVLHGQNSLLSAALIAGAILTLEARPAAAGICIGLLAYKPQLGLLFPLVLAASGCWRAFISAAVTVAAFAGLATLLLGTELWSVFLANTAVVREVLETGQLPWAKMPSAFVFLRMLGVPQPAAYVAHAAVALAAAMATVYVWGRCGPSRLAGATLVFATLLLPPYTFDYEMAMLAVALAILATDAAGREASGAEKLLLLALFVSPPLIAGFGEALRLQVGFPLLALGFAWSVRSALASTSVAEPARAVGTPRPLPPEPLVWRPAPRPSAASYLIWRLRSLLAALRPLLASMHAWRSQRADLKP